MRILQSDKAHRLARLISELPSDEMGTVSLTTQEQMAARLGTVREVVARSLRELERRDRGGKPSHPYRGSGCI